MLITIPFADELVYDQDKEKLYKFGGRWSKEYNCYVFCQADIEAYLLVLDGQWVRVDGDKK